MGVRGRRGGLLVGAVLTVAVAACGGGGDDDDSGGRVDRRDRESPLTEFFGSMDDASNEQYEEQGQRVEAQVAACLEAQGFEYTPVENDFSEPEDGPFELPDKEFAEKYGFGMFTIDWEEEGLGGAVEDPNQERIGAMSEAERAAYEDALWGEFDEMDAVYSRIEENSDVKDAARDWANCMADAGYPDLEDPNMVGDVVQQRYDEMAHEVEEPEPSAEGEDGESISIVDAGPIDSTHGLDPADLEDLRAFEIEVAVADYDCRAEYDEVYFDVQNEVEQEFIDDNREELERYKEASSTAGAVG